MIREKLLRIGFFFLMRESWHYSRGNHLQFVVFILAHLIASVFRALNPWIIAYAINHLLEKESHEVLMGVVAFLVFRFAELLFHYAGRYFQRLLTFRVAAGAFQGSVIKKITSLPISWHEDKHSGAKVKQIQRGYESLKRFMEDLSSNMMVASFNLVFSLGLLFFLNVKIGVFITFVLIVYLFVTYLYNQKLIGIYGSYFNWENKLGALFVDYLNNFFTISALNLKKVFLNKFIGLLPRGYNLTRKKVFVDELKWATGDLISIIIIFTSFYLYYTDMISSSTLAGMGGFFVLINYFLRIQQSLSTFSWLYSEIIERAEAFRNVLPILEEYDRQQQSKNDGDPITPIKEWQRLTIQELYFSYKDTPGVKQIQPVTFQRKQTIGIVGDSGGGKSTFLKLLAGIYPPGSVRFLVDHRPHDFRAVSLISVLVPQEPEIFNDTLSMNLTMDADVEPEVLKKVVYTACLKEFIGDLPLGYDTVLGEKGINISGGEKQRIALARSLIYGETKDLILLDESTSSVDSQIENRIYRRLKLHYGNKTIISVMHRLTSIKNFDHIIVMKNGQIQGQGTFNHLLKNCHPFQILWEHYNREDKG